MIAVLESKASKLQLDMPVVSIKKVQYHDESWVFSVLLLGGLNSCVNFIFYSLEYGNSEPSLFAQDYFIYN